MTHRFCPICGRSVDLLIEKLCSECYVKLNPLIKYLPHNLRVLYCDNCGSVLHKGRWIRARDVVKKIINESIKSQGVIYELIIDHVPMTSGKHYINLRVRGKAHELISKDYEENYKVEVEFVNDLCPTCRLIVMSRERAIVQVRGFRESLSSDELNLIRQLAYLILTKSNNVQRGVIIDIEDIDNGLDIKTTSQAIARLVAHNIHKSFPSKVIETRKVIGVEGGKLKSKLTISIQIIPLKRGDVIKIGNELLYVMSVGKDRLYFKNLTTEENANMRLKELFKKEFNKIPYEHKCLEVKKINNELFIVDSSGNVLKKTRKELKEGIKIKTLMIDNEVFVLSSEVC